MAGEEKRVGIILENLAEISEIIVVCESNSVTIKNGNKLGNIADTNNDIEDWTAKILDCENKINPMPKIIIKIVKK